MTDLMPEHYNIHLEIDLNNFRFSGVTDIEIKSNEDVKEIILNANDLAIWDCKVKNEDQYEDCTFSINPKKEELIIELPRPKKEIGLKINYEGKINDLLVGLYRSKYVKDGKEQYVAVTQFEETDARRAFPCFDHPSKKATFDIEFVIDKSHTAIANTPILEEKSLNGNKKLVKFETTPKMCTYLLFFGVGDWEYIEKKSDNFVHRVVTTAGKTQYGEYALDFGLKCIEYGEKYTGVKYPISKMDQIAVPDFAFGAMENYGAITYRENLLLVYPGITSSAGLERIAEVIAHETAHQWFGNLVSPEDWKYIWLNESFATLFGFEIADFYHPEWQIWEEFLGGVTNGAFERDSLIETFPIELPGGDYIAKINPATAPIIYNKGASILQMVRGYLGVEKFKKGIHAFLTKHQFSTANSDDYWSAFEEATGDPIRKIMKSWVYQPGYPVVEVKRAGDKIKINQKRFTFLPHDNNQVWMIPLTIACYSGTGEPTIIHEIMEEETLEVSIPKDTKVFKVNYEQAGFYRVKYDKEELEKLGELISKKQLSVKDRFGLINDMYAFLRSGDYSIDDFLQFLKYYEDEDEYLPLVDMNVSLIHAYDV
ncbi:MAG: M1 family metallopeptidase, partial [Candidatus Hodarchaeales archaeon]